jgi:hypothetical protein
MQPERKKQKKTLTIHMLLSYYLESILNENKIFLNSHLQTKRFKKYLTIITGNLQLQHTLLQQESFQDVLGVGSAKKWSRIRTRKFPESGSSNHPPDRLLHQLPLLNQPIKLSTCVCIAIFLVFEIK